MEIITQAQAKHKTVLVRVDFNVPCTIHKNKIQVEDDNRIDVALDTINLLLKAEAKIILMSHRGRPGGKVKPRLSLRPIARHLQKKVERPVQFVSKCVGPVAKKTAENLKPGEILVLENLRFHAQEKKNDVKFSKKLGQLADIYVNDAFSTSHRKHASIVGVPKVLPSFAGLALVKEMKAMTALMENPQRPFVMVIGGAKISDKIDAVINLSEIADAVLLGGGVANNFLKAEGFNIASSYLQDMPADLKKENKSYVSVAKQIIEANKTQRIMKDDYIPLPKIIYPIDVVAAKDQNSSHSKVISLINGKSNDTDDSLMYLDIGPKTTRLFQEVIMQARTVFWNGPMGVFEKNQFAEGTREIARIIAKTSATTTIGGGDTTCAVKKFKMEDRFDYVSAAGGASLEFLSGKELPGIRSIKN